MDPPPPPTGTGPAPPPPAAEPAAPAESRVPESVREALRQGPVAVERIDPDAGVDPDDPVVDDGSQDAEALLAEHLGAEIIDESPYGS